VTNIAEGELTTVALCWRIERTDGAGLGLTSHDQSLMKDSVTYAPTPGMVPASITRSLGLEPHSAEVSGVLSSEALEAQDLALGRWDGARVRLLAMDWAAPMDGQIDLLGGDLGEVSIDGDSFSADLQGSASALDRPICPSTSPHCRAEFGDKKCRVDLAGRSVTAVVVDSVDGEISLDRAFPDSFLLGRLRYMSGKNCGRSTVVIAVAGTAIRVRDLPRAPVEAGCRVELREGCDKTFQTCVERFDNAANFRGEPHLPGTDLLTRYPGA
jgi:uncharacterized phage protein (TIGR02218 family)